jgi:hypothetical protein
MKPIRVKDEYGELLVRDSFVVAFFCRRPLRKVAEGFGACFELWLDKVPSDAKKWCVVGPNADSYSPVTARRLSRAQSQFQLARIKPEEIRALRIGGPQEINPDYWFHASAHENLEDSETSVLEIRFPTTVLETPGVSWLLDFVKHVAVLVPYDSGYASLGLTWGVDSQLIDFPEAVRGHAFRHPGFDVADNGGTAFNIADKLRGAYWLTFVGQEALSVLGGPEKLRRKLDRRISMLSAGAGWMLQAGDRPEPGDVNNGEYLPLLRSLAKVLEPVMFFNDEALGQLFEVDEDEEDLERWERRFFLREYGDGGEDDAEDD